MKASRKSHELDSVSRSLKNIIIIVCSNALGCGVELQSACSACCDSNELSSFEKNLILVMTLVLCIATELIG